MKNSRKNIDKIETLRSIISELQYENRKIEYSSALERLTKRVDKLEEQLKSQNLEMTHSSREPESNKFKRVSIEADAAMKDPTRDREAEMMLRFMATRMAASLIASFIGLVPLLGTLMRRSMFGMPFHALKSAENPMFAISFRLLIWSSLMAMYGDDDDDKLLSDMGRSLLFLTSPVLLMTLARDLYTAVTHAGIWD